METGVVSLIVNALDSASSFFNTLMSKFPILFGFFIAFFFFFQVVRLLVSPFIGVAQRDVSRGILGRLKNRGSD